MQPTSSHRQQATPTLLRAVFWCVWLALAMFAATHHAMWRDEIRALSFAERGHSLADMIGQIRGDGHPALWHIILRCALSIYPSPVVLPIVAFAIGAAAAALLAFKAPFRPLLLALALFGAFSTYEYVAVARNYGISVLILFAMAWAWPRYRDWPGAIGALLFLLCNTNVHSVVLANAFLLFWFIELLRQKTERNRLAWPSFLAAVALVLAGIATCVWQAYPPADTAAMLPPGRSGPIGFLVSLVVNVGPYFHELIPEDMRSLIPVIVLLPILLILSITSLRTSPAAMMASAAALIGMELVFQTVYPGYYRHQALFIAFLLTMTWIVESQRSPEAQDRNPVGRMALMTLLALQVCSSVLVFARIANGIPESRSRDLAALLARPDLRSAIVLGDPDTMLEALPYYVSNPIYLAREHRFGNTLIFSRAAISTISIKSILSTAQALHARTHRPIVIVLAERLETNMVAGERDRGYYGPLRIDPGEVREFLSATTRIARFAPAVMDESYDVYVLKDGNQGSTAGGQ
jgi:hypothetical protein